ncbi:MAG TPA: hypothetical protein VI112_14000 [Bacteroidia bacterium]|jgi:hypothetical protein
MLPGLDEFFRILKKDFAGKFLAVNQVFYKGTQKYGTEFFTNLEEFIHYVPFPLLAWCEATMVQDTTIETSTLFRIE